MFSLYQEIMSYYFLLDSQIHYFYTTQTLVQQQQTRLAEALPKTTPLLIKHTPYTYQHIRFPHSIHVSYVPPSPVRRFKTITLFPLPSGQGQRTGCPAYKGVLSRAPSSFSSWTHIQRAQLVKLVFYVNFRDCRDAAWWSLLWEIP